MCGVCVRVCGVCVQHSSCVLDALVVHFWTAVIPLQWPSARALSFCWRSLSLPVDTPNKWRGGAAEWQLSPTAKRSRPLRSHPLGSTIWLRPPSGCVHSCVHHLAEAQQQGGHTQVISRKGQPILFTTPTRSWSGDERRTDSFRSLAPLPNFTHLRNLYEKSLDSARMHTAASRPSPRMRISRQKGTADNALLLHVACTAGAAVQSPRPTARQRLQARGHDAMCALCRVCDVCVCGWCGACACICVCMCMCDDAAAVEAYSCQRNLQLETNSHANIPMKNPGPST